MLSLALTVPQKVAPNLVTFSFLLFMVGLVIAWVWTPTVIRLAHRLGALDQPGERKVQRHSIPRLGGVSVLAAFAMGTWIALAVREPYRSSFLGHRNLMFSLIIGGGLVFCLGLYDDLKGADFRLKFPVQATAALVVIYGGGLRIEGLSNPLSGAVQLGWFAVPFTAIWVVGVTNAFNLIDGLDGLAGGLALISTLTVFGIALTMGGPEVIVLTLACLASSLGGFLRYNLHPARIFLGDCGSMFLGFQLSVLSILGASKRTTALAVIIPILVVGVPVFDTLYTMVRRLGKKVFIEKDRNPSALLAMFQADRGHIHHTLVEMGYTHRRAVVVLHGMAAVFSMLALVAVIMQNDGISFTLMLMGVGAFIVMKKYGRYVSFTKPVPKRVLVVDDSPESQRDLKGILQGPDCDVEAADNLADAEKLILQRDYRVVVTNLHLKLPEGQEGLELLAFVRKRNTDTRVVIMTAYGSDEIREKALALGAVSFIEKPIEREALKSALEEIPW
jgi:UDP-GlcNAc:undecaprenyl-phosphate/decaprenyl-phosphate GlcNAc-1-phosphate transferase